MSTTTFAAPTLAPASNTPAAPARAGLGARLAVLAYGTAVYAFFLATFLYAVGFVWGLVVPKGVDDGTVVSLGETLAVNLGVLGLFGVQHLIMARPGFKAWWTKIIPAAAERSTFVLATCLILGLTFWQWRPLPETVWAVEGLAAGALWTLSALGWGIVLVATFLIDHFELFGLKQSLQYALGRELRSPVFVERFFYRWVRHPLMTGFMLAFWCAPVMSQGRLLFAATCTAFILVALRFEERDLIRNHGEDYLDYKRRVPGLVPQPWRKAA